MQLKNLEEVINISSWTDKIAVNTTLKLRDKFNVKEFIETGTFNGINARFYSNKFENVKSCEVVGSYIEIAMDKVKDLKNVIIYNRSSPVFLKEFRKRYKKEKRNDIVFIYLDAHFYDGKLSKKDKFVVLKELKALKGFKNCIICIHDFWNDKFTGITYDGIKLDFNLLKKDLSKVNEIFKYYTNSECDIVGIDEVKKFKIFGLIPDFETIDNLEYVWSKPEKTYRGIIYAIPKEIDINGLKII